MRNSVLLLVCVLVLAGCDTGGGQTEAPPAEYDISQQPDLAGARFVSPADGDTVPRPVRVMMEAIEVQIVPAGTPAAGQGHFHVVVDAGCVPYGELIPGPGPEAIAAGYHHFGEGAREGEIPLEPGTHELCLQLGDGPHRAFGGTHTITITVE